MAKGRWSELVTFILRVRELASHSSLYKTKKRFRFILIQPDLNLKIIALSIEILV